MRKYSEEELQLQIYDLWSTKVKGERFKAVYTLAPFLFRERRKSCCGGIISDKVEVAVIRQFDGIISRWKFFVSCLAQPLLDAPNTSPPLTNKDLLLTLTLTAHSTLQQHFVNHIAQSTMRFPSTSLAVLLASCDAFAPQYARNSRTISSTELYANRKARRQKKGQNKSKPAQQQGFGEANTATTNNPPPTAENQEASSSIPVSTPDPGVLEAVEIEKPTVSRFIEDENGLKRIADGKCVMDVTTGQAVKLSAYGKCRKTFALRKFSIVINGTC